MKPRLIRRTIIILALAVAPSAFAQSHKATDDSVYQAWGGAAGIRAVIEDFVPRVKADARIGAFFKDINSKHLVQQLSTQLCQVSGGPCAYDGSSMKEAHNGLDIHKAHFNALVEVLQASMDAKGIPFSAQNGMLALLAPMHRDIISRP